MAQLRPAFSRCRARRRSTNQALNIVINQELGHAQAASDFERFAS